MSRNEEQQQYWSQLAPSWLEVEERLERVSGAPGRCAMDHLALRPGQRVIDVGCGSGRTTVELAGLVSPGGSATGVDIAAEMVAHARAHAGSAPAEFVQADAQVDDLGVACFDAAFSRFGVMFFADPVAAFANVRRSVRAGGTLSFACWRSVFDNEWMLVPGMAVASVMGSLPQMPGPDEPGPFSLADPDHVRSVLAAAGFVDIDVTAHEEPVSIPEAEVAVFAAQSTRVGAVREALRSADDDTRRRVQAAIEEALAARVEHGVLRLARSANVVVAR